MTRSFLYLCCNPDNNQTTVCRARFARSLKQTCDKLLLERYQRIQTAFVEIGQGVREVLNGLPEELEEEDQEDAMELWDLSTWVRDKAKGVLGLLEVTRDKVTQGAEVVNGDVSQILADIVVRAEREAITNTRSLHVEAACQFIHASRQIEELLQPILPTRLVSSGWAGIYRRTLFAGSFSSTEHPFIVFASLAAPLRSTYIVHCAAPTHGSSFGNRIRFFHDGSNSDENSNLSATAFRREHH